MRAPCRPSGARRKPRPIRAFARAIPAAPAHWGRGWARQPRRRGRSRNWASGLGRWGGVAERARPARVGCPFSRGELSPGTSRRRLVWCAKLGTSLSLGAIFVFLCLHLPTAMETQANTYLSAATKKETTINSCAIY